MGWIYKGELLEQIGDYQGFVYLITNHSNGKRYIGKKNFYFLKSKQVKGKKKRVKVESDWRSYYGSNDTLNEDVQLFGEKNFRREILRLCTSKGEMSYFEAKYQFEYGVLENNGWYNSWIMCKIRKNHLTFLKKQHII